MKNLLILLLLVATVAIDERAQGQKYSSYPNSSTLQSGDLLLFSRGGNGTYNIDAHDQFLTALGIGTAAYTASSDYDAAGSATAATNGYPWGALYDPIGRALATTNGLGLASGFSAFVPTNRFATSNDLYGASNALQGQITSGGITAPVGTNIAAFLINLTNTAVTIPEINTSSNLVYGNANTAIDTSSNLSFSIERTQINTSSNLVYGNALSQINTTSNSLNGSINTSSNLVYGNLINPSQLATLSNNINATKLVGTVPMANLNTNVATVTNQPWVIGQIGVYGGTNTSGQPVFTPSTLLDATTLTANHHVRSGATTNLEPWEDATGYTNTVAWTHEATATNITVAFNGTLQSFTITNGPTVFFHFTGANGSCSYQILTNVALHFDYQPGWLAGSNSVATNGSISFTSYGGTNCTVKTREQIEAAIKENQ